MSGKRLLVLLGLIVFVVVAWNTSHAITAQQARPLPPLNPANLMTGADVGFVVEGITGGDQVIGRLMVRRDGKWMEAQFKPGNVPLVTR